MTSLFEILKTSKKGMAPDLFTALLAEKFGYTPTPASQQTKTGAPPIYFISDGTPLIAYSIIGNMEQTGTPSKSSPIYPSETGERTEQIFDKNNYINCNGLFVNASTQKIGTVEDGLSLAIPIIGGKTYTVTRTVTTNRFTIGFTNAVPSTGQDAYAITSTTTLNPLTSTAPNNSKYLIIFYARSTVSPVPTQTELEQFINELMVNEGSTAKPYEPYGYKLPIICGRVTTNYYLNEPIRKIGNFADIANSIDVSRIIKEKVFTGNESWQISSAWKKTNTSVYFYNETDIENTVNNHNIYVVSDRFLSTSRDGLYNGDTDMIAKTGSIAMTVRISDTIATTTEAFKQWLSDQYVAGTPVHVWYVLSTPTTESVTAPSIPTIDGEQTFDVDTTLKPSEVTIEYMGW